MANVSAIIFNIEDKLSYSLWDCVSFVFEKERYTPYTNISAVFIGKLNVPYASKVRLFLNGKGVHYGPVDRYEQYVENGVSYIKFSSRGFSMGLSQNQPRPGINSNVNLTSLINQNISPPYVAWEQDTTVSNYIYVKENSSLWDAVVALCQKTYGTYPYIYGENTIRFSKRTDSSEYTNLSNEPLIKRGSGMFLQNMISNIHMKDTDDSYNYEYESDSASEFEIVRHKYISLDRQWLYSPQSGLENKVLFSQKGFKYDFLKFDGIIMTDIRENIVYRDMGQKEVSKIRIVGNARGYTTELWFYDDEYADKT